MATSVLSRKSGVIVGDDVLKLFNYAQEKNFAIPAIVRLPPSSCNTNLEQATDCITECDFVFYRGGLLRGSP